MTTTIFRVFLPAFTTSRPVDLLKVYRHAEQVTFADRVENLGCRTLATTTVALALSGRAVDRAVTLIGTAGLTTTRLGTVDACGFPSCPNAVMVGSYTRPSRTFGTPEIVPVLLLSDSPGGSLPTIR